MPDDSYVAPQDRLLYQYIFSDEFAISDFGFGVQLLMRLSARATGGYIRSSLIRHTGLWAAALALGFESMSVSGHYGQSVQEFHKSLNQLSIDPDGFWAVLLCHPPALGIHDDSQEFLLRWLLRSRGVFPRKFFAWLVLGVIVDGAVTNPTAFEYYFSRVQEAYMQSWRPFDTIDGPMYRWYAEFNRFVEL